MPRPKKPGAPEPKRRSRNGCWNCKARKVKCDEEKPICQNCQKTGEACDYSIRLNWDGRRTKRPSIQILTFDGSSGPAGQPEASPATASAESPGSARPFDKTAKPAAVSPSSGPGYHVFNQHTLASENDGSSPPSCAHSSSHHPRKRVRRGGPDASGSSTTRSAPSTSSAFSTANSGVSRGQPLPGVQQGPLSTATRSTSTRAAETDAGRDAGSPATPDTPFSCAESESSSSFTRPTASSAPQFSSNGSNAASVAGPRGLSVNSLLSGPPGPGPLNPLDILATGLTGVSSSSIDKLFLLSFANSPTTQGSTTMYGIDRGLRDLDVGKNDDRNALCQSAPTHHHHHHHDDLHDMATFLPCPFDYTFDHHHDHDHHDFDVDPQRPHNPARGSFGSYYDRPVRVEIPCSFEPLPLKLRNNPMNLLYFHHFINHTAQVLVPFDGPKSNPFRTILPQLAVKNDHLLSLMLAYSASHRAKLLKQPEPTTRIALWVQDIFPALRHALNDQNQSISNTNVATAIMLASLEIISPTAFGFEIPWQRHLKLARDLISARPGGLRWSRSTGPQCSPSEREEVLVCNFLWSWFAYIDVLGSLSGGGDRDVASDWILLYKVYAPEDDDEVDCIMGFSTSCIYILAKIAELARQCQVMSRRWKEEKALQNGAGQESEQVSSDDVGHESEEGEEEDEEEEEGKDDERGKTDDEESEEAAWKPPPDIVARAEGLVDDMMRSMNLPPRPCPHVREVPDDVKDWNETEMSACNLAYHWAGLLHLHRRVLRKPRHHRDVRAATERVIECLSEVRRGGNAEGCLVFPMFTAGCDSSDEAQRRVILERMVMVENTGMQQVQRARKLMEKCWSTGKPYEELLTTEFVG